MTDIATLITALEAANAENERLINELNIAIQQVNLAISATRSMTKAKNALIVAYNDFISREAGNLWDNGHSRAGAMKRLSNRVSDFVRAGGRLDDLENGKIKLCYNSFKDYMRHWLSEEDLRLVKCLCEFTNEYLYGGGEDYRAGDKELAIRLLKTHKQLEMRLGKITEKNTWGMCGTELDDVRAAINTALETYHLWSWYARVKLSPYRQAEKIDELVNLRGLLGTTSSEGQLINHLIDYYEGDYISETAKMKNVLTALNQMNAEGKDVMMIAPLFTDTLMNEIITDIQMFKDRVSPKKTNTAAANTQLNKLTEYERVVGALSHLTERQRQISLLKASGYKVVEIAGFLGISPKVCTKETRKIREAITGVAV